MSGICVRLEAKTEPDSRLGEDVQASGRSPNTNKSRALADNVRRV